MLKKYISKKSIFYKPYLFFRIFWLEKIFIKRKTYSQCGEDVFIKKFFHGYPKGKYLDIGAFNPIKYNNTYLLYLMGWSGTNIDLNQTSIDLFNIVRPQDENICAAISDKNEKLEVFIENIFSPLNTISKNFSKNLSMDKKKTNSHFIETKRINDIVKDKFDFLNIDIEGLDLKVLKSINLSYYKPKLICIEIFDQKSFDELEKYLLNFNYIYEMKFGPSYFFKLKNQK